MSYQVLALTHTLVAGVDLSGSFRRFIDINASGQAILPTGAGAKAIGVTLDKATLGASCPFQFLGAAPIELGGTVAAGALLTTDAQGRAVTAATGNKVMGIALVGGTIGQIGTILLIPDVLASAP